MENFDCFPEENAVYGCLASQHGLGHVGFSRLMRHFGSPEAVYAASPEERRAAHPQLSEAMGASLGRGPDCGAWEKLLGQCRVHRIRVTAPGWPGYPQPLLELEAPPPLLYLRGAWRPEDARAVALVGTRNPTAYGRKAAFALARDLAAAGYTVVSGLALGIDAAAHAGALAAPTHAGALAVDVPAGGRTLAVIGCGLDIAYPLENLGVRERIEESGAVISEFPPGTPPRPAHFPRRNRLISGLARAVVVVEAGGKSGALITAAHAIHQKKPLFAVPGPIFSPVSEGTTALLRRGALPAASAEDVLRELEGIPAPRRIRREPDPTARETPRRTRRVARQTGPHAAAPDDPVLSLWAGDEACGVDALAERAVRQNLWPREQAAAAVLERLLHLELRGLVRRMPGAAYRLTRRPGRR